MKTDLEMQEFYKRFEAIAGYDAREPAKLVKKRGDENSGVPGKNRIGDMIFTPKHIVSEMVSLIPKNVFRNKDIKILNLCCKDGAFLEEIYWRLCGGLKEYEGSKLRQQENIMRNNIFALCPNDETAEFSRKSFYGTNDLLDSNNYTTCFKASGEKRGNIRVMELDDGEVGYINFKELAKNKARFMEMIEKEFGDMKFDVVIGNPPYNKGMDLDFVNIAFELAEKYVVMITPAKWQTAADDYSGCVSKTIDYKGFREKLVPHMGKVVFYPDALDIFRISQVDGLSYFLLDKNIHDKCKVENRSLHQKYFNGVVRRNIRDRQSLINCGQKIVEHIGNYKKYEIESVDKEREHKVVINSQIVLCGAGSEARKASDAVGRLSNMFNSEGNSTFIGTPRILKEVPPGAYGCAFSSDDIAECESFVSWINTKLTRFFVAINISKLTGILTDDYFRFVPAPPSGKFDHIYTDEELYKAFNLPQKYIDVIEAVIKERNSNVEG